MKTIKDIVIPETPIWYRLALITQDATKSYKNKCRVQDILIEETMSEDWLLQIQVNDTVYGHTYLIPKNIMELTSPLEIIKALTDIEENDDIYIAWEQIERLK